MKSLGVKLQRHSHFTSLKASFIGRRTRFLARARDMDGPGLEDRNATARQFKDKLFKAGKDEDQS